MKKPYEKPVMKDEYYLSTEIISTSLGDNDLPWDPNWN